MIRAVPSRVWPRPPGKEGQVIIGRTRATLGTTRRLLARRRAGTALEYAVMLALIALGAIAAIVSLGQKVQTTNTTLNQHVPAAGRFYSSPDS